MRKIVCRQLRKELSGNGGIAESGLQVLHVHVLLVSPLGACDMAQAGADEHQGGVAVGEGSHNPGPRVYPKNCVNEQASAKRE